MASSQGDAPIMGAKKTTSALLLASCAALSACGGGGGGGTVDISGVDPLVEDFGIAYVKQPVPEMDTQDVREPATFNEGSDLFYRDLASPAVDERNITQRVTGGLGDVKDIEVSPDGSKLVFALRMPEIEGADPEDQPKWNIWEYEIETNRLRRVMQSDIAAEDGHDVAPHYLPDGRIIFSSTRQRTSKAILLDDGKPQFAALDQNRNEPAFVLHVMNDDGSEIKQVTYNQSHDLDPVVLQSGEVVFSRWDSTGIHLYSMYPDGTNLRLMYGANSHDTGTNGATIQFLQSRELPSGNLMALIKPFSGNFQGADVVEIDVGNYVDNTQAVAPNQGILTGPAQVSLSFNEVRTDDQPSRGGRYSSFYPLWDGTDRALVSWSQCRLLLNTRVVPCTDTTLNDPNAVEAPPLYSVFIYDMDNQTLVPVFQPQNGIIYRDAVVAQPRNLASIFFDQAGPTTATFDFDPSIVDENVGILHIRSVHDFDGSYNGLGAAATDLTTLADPEQTLAVQRPARFLRIVKAVSIPDDDLVDLNGADFGVSTANGMREVIAYAPIEPDGSVRMKVPANIPFTISVLDEEGKRISTRHRSWIQLRPGEIMNCGGCHDPASGTSHGRLGSVNVLNTGAPFDGYVFPNTETFFADTGETMAQARTRLDATALEPGVDIRYQDVWTDETAAARLKDASFDYLYADLDPTLTAPVSVACQNNWDNTCRTTINYETHIHPLWGLDRGAGTCTGCHTNVDAMAQPMVPDGQLDLTDGASDLNPDHFKSYRELVSNDLEEIIDQTNGNLVIREELAFDQAGNPIFVTDAAGNLVLDGAGNPIQDTVTFTVPRSMVVGNALASSRFFDRFSDPGNADHFGRLSPAELKLIAEWLDIGGQYYNNPFDVPP